MSLQTDHKLAMLVAAGLSLACGSPSVVAPPPMPDDAGVPDASVVANAGPLTATFFQHVDGGAVPVDSLVYSLPFFLRVTGAPPGATVAVTSRVQRLESQAVFRASVDGVVDTSTDAPLSGAYSGPDPDGLVWTLAPSSFDFGTTFDLGAEVDVMDGGQTFARLARPGMGTGTRQERVTIGTLPGVFYRWQGGERRPAVLVLGGSECRLASTSFVAAYLTTAGYHALAVDYCRNGVISQVPLEGLVAAIDWLASQPDVDTTRLAVVGGSRGGELALELASRDARLKAVVGVVPSLYRWGDTGAGTDSAWTFAGVELPTIPNAPTMTQPIEENLGGGLVGYRLTPIFDADLASATPVQRAAATIEFERARAQVLLVGAADDGVWPSCRYVADAWNRLTSAQHQASHPADRQLCLPAAGYAVGAPGWSTREGYSAFNPALGGNLIFGGTAEGRGRANRAYDTAWRAFLAAAFAAP
ncbi:MAG: acyl-CoA thioester hydrolase/BAAT C-terminal domain-containing protein [Myxococcales bacterium]|nr:acyl-CoA thioester hydrolase/BAAT C-terminal domain-containing protein [Myxococcales bacterium]